MNNLPIENFDEVVARGEDMYKTFVPSYCPFFSDKIHFNAQGLEHLKFKRREKARSRHDQYMRFKLLHLVPEVLKLSRTVQGQWETKHFERIRIHSRTETKLVPVIYYEFVAVLEGVRIKVVVKQIDNGERFFWSLIPFWGVVKGRDGENGPIKRKLHGGDPEED